MPITKIPLNHPFISLYTDDESGIIFHHQSRTLTQLNATAITLLLAIDEGLTQQQVIDEITVHNEISDESIIPIFHQIKSLYVAEKNAIHYADGQYPELSLAPLLPDPSNETIKTYRIANTCFAVLADCDVLFIDISHLLSRREIHNESIDFFIEITKGTENDYSLQVNGLVVESPCRYVEIMPLLIDRMQILAFQHKDYLFCFHGAALRLDNVNILLPGKSGAGKSTLSAELSSSAAFTHTALYSDEMIVLDDKFQLRAIELPIAIKSGSWETLAEKYSTLADEKSWHRLDGRLLKYVWPEQFAQNQKPQSVIINPCFIEGKSEIAENNVSQLPIFETLAMLTAGGYQVGKELDDDDIKALLAFLARTPSYNMTYCSSKQALTQLQQIIGVAKTDKPH